MHRYLFILGRSTGLCIEELHHVVKPLGSLIEVSSSFAVFQGDIDPRAVLPRLGGTIKIARIVDEYDPRRFDDQWLHAMRSSLNGAQGRFKFGASVYGPRSLIGTVHKAGLSLKKRLKALGLSPRYVFNNDGILSSVIVAKESLMGRELIVAQGTKGTYLGITECVQDFDGYSRRDYGRPSRNMKRGMVPPKLAQIMLNLADVTPRDTILDPFCGGGTILQEALLMGCTRVQGTDRDPLAIRETQDNISWLRKQFNTAEPRIAVADVFNLDTVIKPRSVSVIVTEPFLGPATLLRHGVTRDEVTRVQQQVRTILSHLFESLATICVPGARAVIIFPIFHVFGEEFEVEVPSTVSRKGWRLVSPFSTQQQVKIDCSSRGQLVYRREDQIVAREVTLWHLGRT